MMGPKRLTLRITTLLQHVAWLLLIVGALVASLAGDTNAQSASEIQQLFDLDQHERARAAFRQFLKEVPEEKIDGFIQDEPWSGYYFRHPYVRELVRERRIELNPDDPEVLFVLAGIKLQNDKIELADSIASELRDSPDANVRDAFQTVVQKQLDFAATLGPEGKKMTGSINLLSGDYKTALENYESFATDVGERQMNRDSNLRACMMWCRSQIDPDFEPVPKGRGRGALLTAASILAQQKKDAKAIAMFETGMRSLPFNSSETRPFFLEDYPACQNLLKTQSPESKSALRDYETLIKLHQISAAVIAFEKKNGHFPLANQDGVSWRKQLVPFFQLPEGDDAVKEIFLLNEGDTGTPFVVVTGADTAFPADEKITQMYDGTANTLMICVGPKMVPWDSTEDVTADEFLNWRESAKEGVFVVSCAGDVSWYPQDFPVEQWRNFVNRRDKQRFMSPSDLKREQQ